MNDAGRDVRGPHSRFRTGRAPATTCQQRRRALRPIYMFSEFTSSSQPFHFFTASARSSCGALWT